MVGTPTGMMPSNMLSSGVLTEHRDNILSAIRAGVREKNRVYVPGASEVARFYLGQHKYLFDPKFSPNQLSLYIKTDVSGSKSFRTPIFQMSDNVAANYLQIYSPYLLQGVVNRTVEATKPFVPPPVCYGIDPQPMMMMKLQMMQGLPNGQMQAMQYWQQQQQANMKMQIDQQQLAQEYELRQARAEMMEKLLNYTVTELGYGNERKRVVEESLILGCGAYLTQIVPMPLTGQKMIGSQYVMMNDIVWDPDATRTKDCKWLAIQCRGPAWLVSRIHGVPESDLKPNASSTIADAYHQDLVITAGPENVKKEVALDEVIYWKFYSRMGSGARLKTKDLRTPDLEMLDQILGDFCFFVVTDACPYPLNMNPSVFDAVQKMSMQQQQQQQQQQQGMSPQYLAAMGAQPIDPLQPLKQACSWQIPFHLDVDDPWPLTTVEHYIRNGSPYPVPPLEFALAFMKFMVWVISFVADKCYRSQRTFWAIDETNNDQLRIAIEDGQDEAIIKLKNLDQKSVDAFLKMIEAPEIKKSIFEVYEFMKTKFEQMTGMNELNQAQMSRTMRSATEAGILDEASKLRPAAMAKNVLDADSRVARKEGIAWQLLGQPNDVQPVLGGPGAQAWQMIMKSINPIQLMRETTYDVVAAQGRVHDLATRQDQANKMAQLILPLMVQIAMATGQFGAVKTIMTEWCKANQIDPDMVQFPDMPPQAMNQNVKGAGSQPSEPQPQQGP